MPEFATGFKGLTATNNRIDILRADFSGMENLEERIDGVLRRLALRDDVRKGAEMTVHGSITLSQFDGFMSELVRKELGKVLGILRAKAVKKAQQAGAGSASSAVLRRMYRDAYAGNINIAPGGRRISSKRRQVAAPDGGESGIRRTRTVKRRTKQLREYFGPDRGFMLRILEEGRDVYMATSDGPIGRGSKATHGKRGSLAARHWFFHTMKSDMEQAAQQLGQTLTGAVETWVEQAFNE
jgi:hypothetical protein